MLEVTSVLPDGIGHFFLYDGSKRLLISRYVGRVLLVLRLLVGYTWLPLHLIMSSLTGVGLDLKG